MTYCGGFGSGGVCVCVYTSYWVIKVEGMIVRP